jgi:hypothetical protein
MKWEKCKQEAGKLQPQNGNFQGLFESFVCAKVLIKLDRNFCYNIFKQTIVKTAAKCSQFHEKFFSLKTSIT